MCGAEMCVVRKYVWCGNVCGGQRVWCVNVCGVEMCVVWKCVWCGNVSVAATGEVRKCVLCGNVCAAEMCVVAINSGMLVFYIVLRGGGAWSGVYDEIY